MFRLLVPDRTGEAVKTERAKYTTQYDASKFAAALLDARPEVLDAFTSFTINYMDGAIRVRSDGGPPTSSPII